MIELKYKEIGMRIKEKRKSLNLTQLELADKIGLTESSISRYESGKISTMPTSTINKICSVLRIEPSELLGITPDNVFEYDLKDVLDAAYDLPIDIKKESLELFKMQLNVYRRIYDKEKVDYISEKIQE